MITCTVCKSELDPNSEGGIALQIKNYVTGSRGRTWNSFSQGQKLTINSLDVEVVKVRDSWNDGLDSENSSYAHQGATFDAYVVFKVGDFFFKKSGTGDSYGDVEWDGDFGPVALKVRTVEVYDFS